MNGKRVVAYVRRSTKDQAQSLDRQRHEIERWASDRGHAIARWYSDDGVSGTEDLEREGFQKLIRDAEQLRDFDLVLVAEWSRFARLGVYDIGTWIGRLRRAGVSVQAIAGSVRDPMTREGKILIALEGDREELVKLSLRTLSGQRETAEKGYRAGGRCPFGYSRSRRRVDGSIEDVGRHGIAKRDRSEVVTLAPGASAEVEAIQTMFQMARDGVGYSGIAKYLNDLGLPSPDAKRRRTMVRVHGRWTPATVRALLVNPVFAGDLVWNRRSPAPKFHCLRADKIVQIDEFEKHQVRWNGEEDWIIVRDAHPALVDRATFDAVQARIRTHACRPRGHVNEYLLSGLITCVNCGDVMVGTTRTRKKMVGGVEKTYVDLTYVCCATLRRSDRCRQVSLPRDGFEAAVLRILDEELFRPAALVRLEQQLRLQVARQSAENGDEGIPALERRELDLTNLIAEGARRLLQVDPSNLPEANRALAEFKADLRRVQASLQAKRSAKRLAADGEETIGQALAAFRSMAAILRDRAVPLERRKEVLRRLLPKRDGVRSILVEIDPNAGRGWRKALKRVVVRHLSTRDPRDGTYSSAAVVSPAVADEAGQPGAPEWDLEDGLPTWERELVTANFEVVGELIGAGTDGSR